MQSSKEKQGEVRKSSSVNNSKKQRKTTEWERLEQIRDTKGTVHAKMGSIKDRNSMDLTEAEDIKKRWQEYTEELYRRGLINSYENKGSKKQRRKRKIYPFECRVPKNSKKR